MTKIAQCNKCQIGEGVHCEHYRPTDDSDCPHFVLGIDQSEENGVTAFLWRCGIYTFFVMCWCIGAYTGEWVFAYIGGLGLLLAVYLLYIIILLFIRTLKHRYPYMETRKLIIDTLKNIGCQPEVDQKTENINFRYQGENFFIDIETKSTFTIYDVWWGNMELNDPNIEKLKEAINQTNMNATPVTLYSTNENLLGVHSRYRMFFTKDTPDKETLLKVILDSFFSAHQEVNGRFAALNKEQIERPKTDRVRIRGFAASGDVTNQEKENNG